MSNKTMHGMVGDQALDKDEHPDTRPSKRRRFSGLPPYESCLDVLSTSTNPAESTAGSQSCVIWQDTFDPLKASSSTDLLKRELAAVKQLWAIYKVQHHALMEELASQHQQFTTQGKSAWSTAGATRKLDVTKAEQKGQLTEQHRAPVIKEDTVMVVAAEADKGKEQCANPDEVATDSSRRLQSAAGGDAAAPSREKPSPEAQQAAPSSIHQQPSTKGNKITSGQNNQNSEALTVLQLMHKARDHKSETPANTAAGAAGQAPTPPAPFPAPTSPAPAACKDSGAGGAPASSGALHGDSLGGVGSFANWMGVPPGPHGPAGTPQSVNRPLASQPWSQDAATTPTPATQTQSQSQQPPQSTQVAPNASAHTGSDTADGAAQGNSCQAGSKSQLRLGSYHDPVLGYISDEEPACYSDCEEVILEAGEGPCPAELMVTTASAGELGGDSTVAGKGAGVALAGLEVVQGIRAMFAAQAGQVLKLEALASGISEQEMDAYGAIACLAGRSGRYLLRRNTLLLGRPTDTKGEVDVDLTCEGQTAAKVSRRQAYLALEPDGQWRVTNAGRRPMHVDGKLVEQFGSARANHLSLIEVGGVRLLLLVNSAAVDRVLRRTARAAL